MPIQLDKSNSMKLAVKYFKDAQYQVVLPGAVNLCAKQTYSGKFVAATPANAMRNEFSFFNNSKLRNCLSDYDYLLEDSKYLHQCIKLFASPNRALKYASRKCQGVEPDYHIRIYQIIIAKGGLVLEPYCDYKFATYHYVAYEDDTRINQKFDERYRQFYPPNAFRAPLTTKAFYRSAKEVIKRIYRDCWRAYISHRGIEKTIDLELVESKKQAEIAVRSIPEIYEKPGIRSIHPPPTKGLIIQKPWLDKIFESGKRWEMRSKPTKVRGPILLIEAGSGLVVGECLITGSMKIPPEERGATLQNHQVEDLNLLEKWCYAWRLEFVEKFPTPLPYDHPRGAVIWVNL